MEINTKLLRADLILPIIHMTSVIFIISVQISIANIYNFIQKNIKKDNKFELIFQKFQVYQITFSLFFIAKIISGILLQNEYLKLSNPLLSILLAIIYAISILLFINFIYISCRFFLAKKAYKKKDDAAAKDNLHIIFFYFIPFNTLLSFLLVYLEIIIESF